MAEAGLPAASSPAETFSADGYTPQDAERLQPEQHSSPRSDFARDRARLLHSSALRRLAAKTQVLSPASMLSFARTRLTHSLEVAQIGRELASSLGSDPDVVDTACLAHDLGHPPFGHNGENALNAWAAEHGGFEGNAQTLRLLTRLEPKVIGEDGRSLGLNLTRASLDASVKYPWSRERGVERGTGKFGVYADDRPVFDWIRLPVAADDVERKSMEAQVMDLADDIAYSVHDFEDAVVNGYIEPDWLSHRSGHGTLIRLVAEWDSGPYSEDDLGSAFERVRGLSQWLLSWDGSRADQARLKNFTSQLIGRFIGGAITATREVHPEGPLTRYGAEVVVPHALRSEIAVLKGIVGGFVMNSESRQPLYREQRQLLAELAEEVLRGAPETLDPAFAEDWVEADTADARHRVVVDQIASMTDQEAIHRHGQLIPGGRAARLRAEA